MHINALIQELEAMTTEPGKAGDCGCSGVSSSAVSGSADELTALEAELDALEGNDLDGPPGASMLTGELDIDDELDFAAALGDESGDSLPTLEEVLALAKEYRGLKISFGF